MAITFGERIRHAWNVFRDRDSYEEPRVDLGASYSIRPDRIRFSVGTERSIVLAIYTRIGIDAAAFSFAHVRTNQNGNYVETIPSSLHHCLTEEANIDQTARAFIQDVVMSLCDEGVVAVVPVDVKTQPRETSTFEVETLRTAQIIEWYPRHVRVRIYNDRTGQKEERIVPKNMVAIIENPLYAVMNEPNSTLKRLIHKLNLLDILDNQNSSGKLDLIIQLPYVIKTDSRKEQADRRRAEIEQQLVGSKYGIAYTDGTEKITQLNRPVENNLLQQIEILTRMLYSQLGISENILHGTADEQEQINYYNRTIEPILAAITAEFQRKFLSRTARSQGHRLFTFNEPFRLVPANNMAEIADKFTRNEILTSNEVRALIGFLPSTDPEADELRNKNLNRAKVTPQVDDGKSATEVTEVEAEVPEEQNKEQEE